MDLLNVKKQATAAELEEWTAQLRESFPPGSTAYTILRHVSGSGMTRYISVLELEAPDVHDWSYRVAGIVDRRLDRDSNGVKVEGAGMDMGFELVYNLSRALYPDGFDCIGAGDGLTSIRGHGCPANDHSNGDRNYTIGRRHEHAGGYAVSHRWL